MRIEDNDHNNLVEGGIHSFLEALSAYEINIDEGYSGDSFEVGNYGPYVQTGRKSIYQVFVKELVAKGVAYPCFCSKEKLKNMRLSQMERKEQTGYYGNYAQCCKLSPEDAAKKFLRGEPFVIRIRSEYLRTYTEEYYDDLIKGRVKLTPSNLDIIILKASGIPDYNFAHVVDDHLMGTTIITRCEDWLPSLHTHLSLFALMRWKPPKYAHIGALSIKLGEQSVVKINKKLGETVTVEYYLRMGYIPNAFKAYFSSISCSGFEDWWLGGCNGEYKFSLNKMSSHRAIFDIAKLNYISRLIFDRTDIQSLCKGFSDWLCTWHPELYEMLTFDMDFVKDVIRIIKGIEIPRRAIACYKDILEEALPFFSIPHRGVLKPGDRECLCFIEKTIREENLVNVESVRGFLSSIAEKQGLKIKDISNIIRRMIVGKDTSPSIFEILMVFGRERICKWIKELE